jgi:hypothetical protein
VKVLSDDTAEKPTREAILSALSFVQQGGARDTVVIFLASHGITDTKGNYYFVPSDVNAATSSRLSAANGATRSVVDVVLRSAARRRGRRLLIVDTCHAGSAEGSFDSHSLMKRSASSLFPLIVASKGEEKSQEYVPGQHGLFTYALMNALARPPTRTATCSCLSRKPSVMRCRSSSNSAQGGGRSDSPDGRTQPARGRSRWLGRLAKVVDLPVSGAAPAAALQARGTTGRPVSFFARLKRFQFPLFVVIASIIAAEGAHRSGVLATMEHLYTDLWHRESGVRFNPDHVALVVVDDQSLVEHGDVPMVFWTPLFARAAATLREAGATVVGVDFLFGFTPEDWISKLNLSKTDALRDYDLAFRQELNKGKIVLVGSVVRGNPARRTACCSRIPIPAFTAERPISFHTLASPTW